MADPHLEQLEKAKQLRNKFIDKLATDDEIYTDTKKASIFLKSLSDSDKQVQTSQRLKVEETSAGAAADQAKAFNTLSESIAKSNQNPFRVQNPISEEHTPEVKKSGKFEIHDTELNLTPKGQNYDQFTERRKKEEQERLANKK